MSCQFSVVFAAGLRLWQLGGIVARHGKSKQAKRREMPEDVILKGVKTGWEIALLFGDGNLPKTEN
jgi:hypothetical protein